MADIDGEQLVALVGLPAEDLELRTTLAQCGVPDVVLDEHGEGFFEDCAATYGVAFHFHKGALIGVHFYGDGWFRGTLPFALSFGQEPDAIDLPLLDETDNDPVLFRTFDAGSYVFEAMFEAKQLCHVDVKSKSYSAAG